MADVIVSNTAKAATTFVRGTGATRINAAGLIVGVDFSSTSTVFGTGSKSFTLTADVNVDRDWVIGSSVVAVSQAAPLGQMTGTVVSYSAASQTLIINVVQSTGTGTGTNWRIGSLEQRLDYDPVTLAPRGVLVEGGATNLLTFSEDFGNAAWSKTNVTVSTNTDISPDGSMNADTIVLGSPGNRGIFQQVSGIPKFTRFVFSFWIKLKSIVSDGSLILTVVALPSEGGGPIISGNIRSEISSSQFTRVSITVDSTGIFSGFRLYIDQNGTFQGDISVWGAQILRDTIGSYIPTTTTQITRSADLLNVESNRLSQFYNQSLGTIVADFTPIPSDVSSVAASVNDGTTRNAVRIQNKLIGSRGSLTKVSTDGVRDVYAVGERRLSAVIYNGLEYLQVIDGDQNTKTGSASNGSGGFLLVGNGEDIRSLDATGNTLTTRTIGGSYSISSESVQTSFYGTHFGLNRFIVAGSTSTINGTPVGSVIVSPDGVAFRRINIPGLTQQLNEITSNTTNGTDGTLLVAVGEGGAIVTSADSGETWVLRTSGTASRLTAVHNFSGTYVAVSDAGANSRYSTNGGATWNPTTGLAGNIQDVYHNGTDRWIAVGANGTTFYTSSDGIAWTTVTVPTSAIYFAVFFADGLWVAAGANGTLLTSPDGTTWTNRSANSGTTQQINEVGFFAGKFYYAASGQVIGENTAAAIVAGTTWTLRTANVTSTLSGIASSATRLLINGTNGAITTSDDGTTFTSRTGNGVAINGAAFGAGTYVSVGSLANGSSLIATINPTTFAYTRRVSPLNSIIFAVRHLNGVFLAAVNNTLGLVSTDNGVTWNTVNWGRLQIDVAFSSGRYFAASDTGRVLYADVLGTTTQVNTGVGQNLNGIEAANGIVVAVGNAGVIVTSSNAGVSFTQRTSGTLVTLRTVHYSTRDSLWYVAGDGGVILRSPDAITWTRVDNQSVGAVINNGSIVANTNQVNLNPGRVNTVAMRLENNNVGVSTNQFPVAVDTSVTLPNVTKLSIGMAGDQTLPLNGWVRKIKYYGSPLSNSNLIRVQAGLDPVFTLDALLVNGTDKLKVDATNTLGVN